MKQNAIQRMVVIGSFCFLGVVFALVPESAFAMPWDSTLKQLKDNLSGPTVVAISTIVFVVIGLLIAFGEDRGIMGTILRVALGLSFALMATTWVGTFSGGAVG